ncbi:MAG: hypothetical protein DRO88_09825 [Promethearchaeia archaeon]|nr:MAG: hypothetical protein DRO88_09825 [Candidatus Lokiarchaeia archaeon]
MSLGWLLFLILLLLFLLLLFLLLLFLLLLFHLRLLQPTSFPLHDLVILVVRHPFQDLFRQFLHHQMSPQSQFHFLLKISLLRAEGLHLPVHFDYTFTRHPKYIVKRYFFLSSNGSHLINLSKKIQDEIIFRKVWINY